MRQRWLPALFSLLLVFSLPLGPALALAATHEECCAEGCEGGRCHLDVEALRQRAAEAGHHAEATEGGAEQAGTPSCHSKPQPIVAPSPGPELAFEAQSDCCQECPPGTSAHSSNVAIARHETDARFPGFEALRAHSPGNAWSAARTSANPRAPPHSPLS